MNLLLWALFSKHLYVSKMYRDLPESPGPRFLIGLPISEMYGPEKCTGIYWNFFPVFVFTCEFEMYQSLLYLYVMFVCHSFSCIGLEYNKIHKVHLGTSIYVYIHTCVYMYIYIYISVCMHIHIYIYISTHTQYIYIYIYMYT